MTLTPEYILTLGVQHSIGDSFAVPTPKQIIAFARAIEAESQKWLPIESAPKDGAQFLLLHHDGSYCISYWGSIRGKYGWKSTQYHDHTFCLSITGWRPLPSPPRDPKEPT